MALHSVSLRGDAVLLDGRALDSGAGFRASEPSAGIDRARSAAYNDSIPRKAGGEGR